ncbi:MAG: TolC family protein, partial [Gammaproteobacteria bacterium]|nr:TolC family protein [Gammaproteobacteria bacterium]
MSMKRQASLITAMFLLMNQAVLAETLLIDSLLPAVVDAAFERYPDRVLPAAINQQGKAIRRQASSLLAKNPSFTVTHENDALTDTLGFQDWTGSVQLPLWLPGQRSRRVDVADATDLEAMSLTRFYKWRVSGEVRELLWSTKIAEAEVTLARAAVDSAQALETDIDKRVKAGELARTDHILARKETLARQITLATATANLDEFRKQYHMLTGFTEIPKDISEKNVKDTSLPLQHPTLLAASYRTDRARAQSNQV